MSLLPPIASAETQSCFATSTSGSPALMFPYVLRLVKSIQK